MLFEVPDDLIGILRLLVLLPLGISLLSAAFTSLKISSKGILVSLAGAIGLFWTGMGFCIVYNGFTGGPFLLSLTMESLYASWWTVVSVLGTGGTFLLFFGLVVSLGSLGFLWHRLILALERKLQSAKLSPALGLLSLGLFLIAFCQDVGLAAKYSKYTLMSPVFPFVSRPLSKTPFKSDENVFVIQLESISSLIAADPKSQKFRVPFPGMETLLKEGKGVLYPLAWANSNASVRAYEGAMCAVSGNMNMPLSFELGKLSVRDCLPRVLSRSGYQTIYFYPFYELEFTHMGDFARAMGFQEIFLGPEFMKKEDRKFRWSYDDCAYYNRVFDILDSRQSNAPLFAHLIVSMHHFPWAHSQKYPSAHPFAQAKSTEEEYLNSLAEQDHCLLTFWKRFAAKYHRRSHLFVYGDHTAPYLSEKQEWKKSFEYEFRTMLAYVPPETRRQEFKSRVEWRFSPSHAEVAPTILELLSRERDRGSFAFSLMGKSRPSNYEDCHMFGFPHVYQVALHGSEIHQFDVKKSKYLSWSLDDSARQLASGSVPMRYEEFHERYFCK